MAEHSGEDRIKNTRTLVCARLWLHHVWWA